MGKRFSVIDRAADFAAALYADWQGHAPQVRVRQPASNTEAGWRAYSAPADQEEDPKLLCVSGADNVLTLLLLSSKNPGDRFAWLVEVPQDIPDERLFMSVLWGRLSRLISPGWQDRAQLAGPGIYVIIEP